MKTLKYFIAVTSIMLSVSCSEDFTELSPLSEQSADNFYNSALDIEQAVIGAYDALQSESQYGGESGFNHFMEVRADNSFNSNPNQEGGSRADFDNFSLDPTNRWVNNTWISCYDGINRCNTILNRIGGVDMEEDLKSIREGEVKFLRALTYFNLVRIWGDVPLVTDERSDVFESFNDTRSESSEIYNLIITDLNDAINSLPEKSNTDPGRASRGAAQALLGTVYLTLADWSNAVSNLEEVVNSSDYSLETNFEDIFDVNNEFGVESIFEVSFLSGTNGDGLILNTNTDEINNKPSMNYINFTANYLTSNPNDVRPSFTIDTLSVNGGSVDALNGKLQGPDEVGSDGSFDSNIIILRYADVLLMLAEAINEQGYQANGAAFDYLNEVRIRAGANPFSSADLADQVSFRQAIADERRLELAFENHRWFDLVRTGEAVSVMNAAPDGAALAFEVASYQTVFPIPQAQIDASAGALTQNPNY